MDPRPLHSLRSLIFRITSIRDTRCASRQLHRARSRFTWPHLRYQLDTIDIRIIRPRFDSKRSIVRRIGIERFSKTRWIRLKKIEIAICQIYWIKFRKEFEAKMKEAFSSVLLCPKHFHLKQELFEELIIFNVIRNRSESNWRGKEGWKFEKFACFLLDTIGLAENGKAGPANRGPIREGERVGHGCSRSSAKRADRREASFRNIGLLIVDVRQPRGDNSS